MDRTPARHSQLFELIRQENQAAYVRSRYKPASYDITWVAAFTAMALKSLKI